MNDSAKRVSRDVDAAQLSDLLERPLRATVAFVDEEVIDAVPVRVRCEGDTYAFGLSRGGAPALLQREVVLLLNDGCYWFELRGIAVRGTARASAPPPGTTSDQDWYALVPTRVLAWDYGTIHVE